MTDRVPHCTCGHPAFAHYGPRDVKVLKGKVALIGQCATRDCSCAAYRERR